jgi:ariadne-1
MGDWKEHGANTGGYYKCNKYGDEASGVGGNSDAARAKRELDRYLHYYQRFHAHEQAEIFARKQLVETEQRMVKLQESENSKLWSDVEFLKTANEQLVECRRVLKYTYVFGFYLIEASKMQRERFEHHQEMLERFTENLSELSEMPLEKMDRTDVVNQTRVVDRFMKNILKYVDDDMEENV